MAPFPLCTFHAYHFKNPQSKFCAAMFFDILSTQSVLNGFPI